MMHQATIGMLTSLFEGRPRFFGASPGVDPSAVAAGLAFLAGWPSPSVVAALFTGCTQQF